MKKRIILWILCGVAILALTALFVWWSGKTVFLPKVQGEEIACITVRDGSNGQIMELEQSEDISYLIEAIQNLSFQEDGLSLFHMGTWFTLTFIDEMGAEVDQLIVNGAETIRKDPFFYRTESGALQPVLDYLCAIEEKEGAQ